MSIAFASPRPSRVLCTKLGLAGLLGVAMALPRVAHAQLTGSGTGTSGNNYGIALTNSVVPRFYPDGTSYPFRAANLNPNDINFQDCEDNIVLQFNVTETGIGTTAAPDIVQIWAGTTDCTQTTARSGGVSPFCWQVYPAQEPTAVASFNIWARSLTRYIDTSLTSVPNSGNPVVGGYQPEAACHTQTTSGQVALNIYFMFLPNTGDATPDASMSYSLNIDMVGPLAPTSLTAGIGDQMLIINWTPQVDPTIQGFNIYAQDLGPNGLGLGADAGGAVQTTPVYCKAGSTTLVCPDAGHVADGAADVTVSDAACTTVYTGDSGYTEVPDAAGYASLSDASLAAMGCARGFPSNAVTTGQIDGGACTSSVLVDKFSSNVTITTSPDSGAVDGAASVISTIDGASSMTGLVGISQVDFSLYGVGNVGGNTTSSYVIQNLPDGGPLVNGHQYALAVAAYDDDGNIGLLSPLSCQTPEPVIDFWDRYKQDGGLAGGGFCSLEGPGIPMAGSVFGLGLGAALVAVARRRRRRSS